MNVVAALIVDRQSQARVADEELLHAEHVEQLNLSFKKLHGLFESMDSDGAGSLSLAELLTSYEENLEFRDILEIWTFIRTTSL